MMYGAYANLSDLVDFSAGPGEELFERMDKIFKSAKNRRAPFLLPLHYAYAKALDDRGEHERALNHYITGGKIKRSSARLQRAGDARLLRLDPCRFPQGSLREPQI